jgi:ferritin-like metal-binding protein YciE
MGYAEPEQPTVKPSRQERISILVSAISTRGREDNTQKTGREYSKLVESTKHEPEAPASLDQAMMQYADRASMEKEIAQQRSAINALNKMYAELSELKEGLETYATELEQKLESAEKARDAAMGTIGNLSNALETMALHEETLRTVFEAHIGSPEQYIARLEEIFKTPLGSHDAYVAAFKRFLTEKE